MLCCIIPQFPNPLANISQQNLYYKFHFSIQDKTEIENLDQQKMLISFILKTVPISSKNFN